MAEEFKRLLECPMCLDHYDTADRWPKLLPCQHTLCLECMEMLNQDNRILCPQCRQGHPCPADGPQQLPNNFTMLALLDVQQKSGSSSPALPFKEAPPPLPSKSETTRPPAINEGVRNSIALLARKLQEKSVELSKIDHKEKQMEEMFLSIKKQVDTSFESRTKELQTRRDQLIKQLAGARQEELSFLQGQRASAYQYLQKLQTDFSKMRQSIVNNAEPREADLIGLLGLSRGYLSQIEQYALNIDQRVCSVAFSDPNQQQLSVSIKAYGCLNISTDKTKSAQAARQTSNLFQGAPVSQSSPSNPFNPTSSPSSTSSLILPSPSSSSLQATNGSVGSSVSPSPAVTPVTSISTTSTPQGQVQRSFSVSGTPSNRRLSEPVGLGLHSGGASSPSFPLQPFQIAPASSQSEAFSTPTPSTGLPSQSNSASRPLISRHLSLDAVASSLQAANLSVQANPAGGDQPPPIPRRPGSVRLSAITEQSAIERPRSVLLRTSTTPSHGAAQNRVSAPPLPPRVSTQGPDTAGTAGRSSPQSAAPAQSTSNGTSSPQQPWVAFNSNSNSNQQPSSSTPFKRTTVINQNFEKPTGVCVLDKLNNCFAVADELQHCVLIVNEEGKLLSRMGSQGGGAGQMQYPKAVCANSSGNLIISDWYNHKVQLWDLRIGFIRQFGSRGQGNTNFNGPLGVTCDKQDNIYVCDYNNGCVKVFTQTGEFLRQIGKKGERDGQFRSPCNIAFTQGGELLITDASKHCVHVFTSQGTYLYRFGSWGTGPGDLNCPHGIAVDAQGYIYVSNNGNHRIEVFNPSGSYALSLGRHGTEPGLYDEPMGISVSKDGRLLVSDSGNKRLQLIWP